MGWRIDWTEPALDDLADVVAFIAADDPEVAVRVGDKIAEHVELLKGHPEMGSFYRRRPAGDIQQILEYPFRIFYRLRKDAEVVEILHVWHGARDEPKDL
jgi:toxin ParE1/3/4